MTVRLTPHFSLEELTMSQTAERMQLDNVPVGDVLHNLHRTARSLETVRALLGDKPLVISSGYRSPRVNQAVGGSRTSAHMDGHAIDFICPQFGSPLAICKFLAGQKSLQFDQLIQEGTWVHISFAPLGRRELLTKSGSGFVNGIQKAK